MAPIMPLHVRPLCTKWVMSCSTCTKWKWDICHNNDNFLTFPFEHINHARSGMIFQALHQGLQHPLKRKFPFLSATVIICVSQYDHELTTLPRVYSSRSCVCPLFHHRNHAFLLREFLALSPKSLGSSPPLTMGASH